LKAFFKSFVDFINHPKFSNLLSTNDDFHEVAKRAISEDNEFLGIIPLRVVHQDINFNVFGNVDMLKVRFARLIIFGKKISETKVRVYKDMQEIVLLPTYLTFLLFSHWIY
jgi:hypothetical protein